MTSVWRAIRNFRGRRAIGGVVFITATSLIAGLLEAFALVAAVGVATSITSGDSAGGTVQVPFGSAGEADITSVVWLALIAAVVTVLLHVVVAWGTGHISGGMLGDMRQRVLRSYIGASWERQSIDREGALQEGVGSLSIISARLTVQLVTALTSAAALAALVGTAIALSPASAAVVVAVGALASVITRPLSRLTRRRANEFVRNSTAFSEDVGQLAGVIFDLRAFGVERDAMAELQADNRRAAEQWFRSRWISRMTALAYKDIAIVMLVLLVGYLHWAESDDIASIGGVAVLLVRALGYGQRLQATRQSIAEDAPSLALLIERIESLEAGSDSFGDLTLPEIRTIELLDVHYRYPSGADALRGVNLCIEAGDYIGVIGQSGGGKSTLVEVILRLRQPSEGRVEVNGVDYRGFEATAMTDRIAVVPQSPSLFEGTLRENISLSRSHVTDDDVVRAARLAHLWPDIERMTNGLDSTLGPRGSGLSGGQRQRLAIARALAGRPDVVILDEPTSALDPSAELVIQETIEELKGTITLVVIAHRLSTLRACERVIGLRNGQIAVEGGLDEVAQTLNYRGDGVR